MILKALSEVLGKYNPDLKKKKGRKSKKTTDGEHEEEKLDDFESERMQEYIDLYKYIKGGFNVVIEVDKMKTEEIKMKHIAALIKKANSLGLPLNLFVSGYSQFGKEQEHVDMLFSSNILGTFAVLNSFLEINGEPGLRFLEDPRHPENAWTLDEVVRANREVETVVNSIKFYNFTPLEAMAFTHYYITSQFPYKENVDQPVSPRSIIGLLNSEDIVCVGYSKLTKAILDKLNMKGLSAETIDSVIKPIEIEYNVKVSNKLQISGFGHCQNVVNIDDPTYSVKGVYMEDACWDTKNKEFVAGKGFGNFLYPVADTQHYDGFTYQEIASKDPYDLTKTLEADTFLSLEDQPVLNNSWTTKPISSEIIDNVIEKMLKKIYPRLTKKELDDTANYYKLISRVVAASVFGDDAQSEYAKEGKKICQEHMKDGQIILDQDEIMK